jgi:hypothetical protein
MKFSEILKSPVFARGYHWPFKRRKLYESDVSALVRKMLEDESIQRDQRFAWDRWRDDERAAKR